MFHHSLDRNVSPLTAFNWFSLSFLAGNVNAGGLLGCHTFVSHVTGFATLTGVEWAGGKGLAAFAYFTVPLYFLLGVVLSAIFIDRRIHNGKPPRYALVMSLVALCLIVAAVGGLFHFFGEFGSKIQLERDYMLLALLCMASGLQNAALTTASGATVRTTHMTGNLTDLGLGLVRGFFHKGDREQKSFIRKTNVLRLGTIFSFILGSTVGGFLFLEVGYLGFLFPAGIALYAVFQELHHDSHQELEAMAERMRAGEEAENAE